MDEIDEKLDEINAPDPLRNDLMLLYSMYSEDVKMEIRTREKETTAHVTLHCRPRTGFQTLREFVFCEISVSFVFNVHSNGVSKLRRIDALLRKSRGLDQGQINQITSIISSKTKESEVIFGSCGSDHEGEGEGECDVSLLFELMESVSLILTEVNESGDCSICLGSIAEPAATARTEEEISGINAGTRGSCYHRYHYGCIIEWCFICFKKKLEELRDERGGKRSEKDAQPDCECPVCKGKLSDYDIPGLHAVVMSLHEQENESSVSHKDDDGEGSSSLNPPIPVKMIDLTMTNGKATENDHDDHDSGVYVYGTQSEHEEQPVKVVEGDAHMDEKPKSRRGRWKTRSRGRFRGRRSRR